MDFQRFGIDPRLAQAAEGLPTNFFFYEKMLSHVVEKQENVCVKMALDNGREEVLLLPALQWILSGEGRKALVVVPDAAGADRCADAVDRLGSGAGIAVCRAIKGEADGEQPRLEGDPSASVLIGAIEDLLEAPGLNLRDYGFLVVDGVDRLAEQPPESIRKFCGFLLPSWERRSLLACARLSVKAKNLAWDLADNPSEISIEGEVAKAQSVLKETWSVPGESKLKFLLGLLEREKPARLCVFCNLKDTAAELSRRLSANGVRTDSINGGLLPERKFALIEKFRAGDCTCLVLTDEGAEGLTPGVFPLIVNYDFPLEPEFFVKRLEMLDRADPASKIVSLACDRYIYGLPAVEQYIDAKLDAVPADPSMLATADKSEGMSGGRPRGDAGARDARRGPPQRRDPYPRDPGQRGTRSREAYPRDANRLRDAPREGRSPDIRKSISEATGGALDMGGTLPPDSGYPLAAGNRPMANKPSPKGEPRRGQRPPEGRQAGGNKEGRREDPRRGGKASGRQQHPRPSSGKPRQGAAGAGSPGAASSGPVSSGPVSSGNPYDMPMEERMKIYREKYGHNLGEDAPKAERGRSRNEQKGGQRGGHGGQQGGKRPASGGQRPSSPRAPEQRPQGNRAPAPQPPRNAAARNPEGPKKPEGAKKPEGVVGRFLGAFKKKKKD